MSFKEGFFAYWGKASPLVDSEANFHLLPHHSLDVAACGQVLSALPSFSLKPLAEELGWTQPQVESLFTFFLALHDLGKFARAFQGLVPDLSPDLVPADASKRYDRRHDTLGWLLWSQDLAADDPIDNLPQPEHEFWAVWVRSVVGHHGKPPEEVADGGLTALELTDFFLRADRRAAREFVQALAGWMLPADLPVPDREQLKILRRHAWRLAGLAV